YVVRAVRIAHLEHLGSSRDALSACPHRGLRHPVEPRRATDLVVVAGVRDVQALAGAARPPGDGLPVVVDRPGDGIDAEVPSGRVGGENLRWVARIVQRPEHAWVAAARDHPGALEQAWMAEIA